MMIKPGITQLSRYVDSRYTLVTMVAKRARMIGAEQSKAEHYDPKAEKPVTVAVNEIAKGKVGYVRSETIRRVKELEAEKAAAIISLNESDVKSLDELVKEAQAAEHDEQGALLFAQPAEEMHSEGSAQPEGEAQPVYEAQTENALQVDEEVQIAQDAPEDETPAQETDADSAETE